MLLLGHPVGAALSLPKLFGGPFQLTDETGRRVGPETYRGRFMLIYFGYSYCPDICPTDLADMAAALDLLGDDGDAVQPLLITVDPARDRPEVLKEFTSAFHPDLVGLTGSEAEIAAVARAYRVHRRKFLLDGAAAEDYLVDHSTLTYLMGPDGAFLTMFPRGTAPEEMARRIRNYLPGKG